MLRGERNRHSSYKGDRFQLSIYHFKVQRFCGCAVKSLFSPSVFFAKPISALVRDSDSKLCRCAGFGWLGHDYPRS
jgi:hypothetical protein